MGRDAQGEGSKPFGFLSYKSALPSVSQGWKPWRMQNFRSLALEETLGTTSLEDVKPDTRFCSPAGEHLV